VSATHDDWQYPIPGEPLIRFRTVRAATAGHWLGSAGGRIDTATITIGDGHHTVDGGLVLRDGAVIGFLL
jgi:hypothetical protein